MWTALGVWFSVFAVNRRDGWVAPGMLHKHACSCCLNASDRGHKLKKFVRQKTAYMQPCFLDETWFSPWDSSLLPLQGVWSGPFSPWSDVHYSVLAASSLLCCIIITNSDSESSNMQSLRRVADSEAEQRGREFRWEFPCFSENWGRWGGLVD